ncbi:MAG: hypothetical protein NC489_08955 [Ruminococcus flavefaciens]|nr:hypothetical protein [Ruminococcus flavefaciens]
MDKYQSDATPIETSENVRIIGSFSVPAVSYSRDTFSYRGPIDELFFDVTGWDSEARKPIGEIPQLIPNVSAFYVQVLGSNDKVIKVFIAKVTRVYGYQLGEGNKAYLKCGYVEVAPAFESDVTVVDPVIAHIFKDTFSDFIALILEGEEDACVQYAQTKLDSFKHGTKIYHGVSVRRFARRVSRELDGNELHQTLAVIVIAHPEFPSPDTTTINESVESYLRRVYNV